MTTERASPMIMRTWRAQVQKERVADYERFAEDESLLMFRAQPGCRGVLFGRNGTDCVVVTFWEDDAAADALELSPSYRETVARIRAAGFLSAELGAERFNLHGPTQVDLVKR